MFILYIPQCAVEEKIMISDIKVYTMSIKPLSTS